MLFRFAWRELRRSWKTAIFFILNLSLGLTGFIALEAYKTALRDHVRENRREILAGDLAVSARRELSETELTALNSEVGDAPGSVEYDFFAMISSAKTSRLALVKAVDGAYPLYGHVTLEGGIPLKIDDQGLWSSPEIARQLGLAKGDRVKVGALDLELKGIVEKDDSQTFRSRGFAPRVYIDRARLTESGLIRFGSTFSVTRLYRWNSGVDELRERLVKKITDPAVEIETANKASEDSARQLGLLSDFLGLVALVGLFLAALGSAYLWRLFLQGRMKDIAILRSLGLDGNGAILLSVMQAAVLGAFSLIPALFGAQLLLPLLGRLLALVAPFDLAPVLTGASIAMGFALCLGTSLLVSLPFLLRLRELKPARLFSEDKFTADIELRRPWAFLPAIALFWALAILQSNSIKVGSFFIVALFAVLATLAAFGWLMLRFFDRRNAGGSWEIRHGLRGASRRRAASLSIFLAMGLGSLLMNVLPQIKTSLQKEMTFEGGSKLPSLFLFDIQDEQVAPVRDIIRAEGTDLNGLSPLVRARILKVNDQNYERLAETGGFRTREEENEARFRNRGVNLSFRTELSPSEQLTEGRPLATTYDAAKAPAELSVEEKYAGRMGFHLGDRLVFDVQGLEVEGVIVNLRKVKWTTFQPNFFILVQPGVLEDAPKTWIASVPRLSEEKRDALQSEISAKLGNVSVIDVVRSVTEALAIAEQMSWSLELMAALSLATGAVVLFSIARMQARGRRWELNLLKVLGARASKLRRYVLTEFVLLAGVSSLLGGLLSLAVSSLILKYFFDTAFAFDARWILGVTIVVTTISALVAERASAAVIAERPLSIFRGDG